jgi:hypothetical protein
MEGSGRGWLAELLSEGLVLRSGCAGSAPLLPLSHMSAGAGTGLWRLALELLNSRPVAREMDSEACQGLEGWCCPVAAPAASSSSMLLAELYMAETVARTGGGCSVGAGLNSCPS